MKQSAAGFAFLLLFVAPLGEGIFDDFCFGIATGTSKTKVKKEEVKTLGHEIWVGLPGSWRGKVVAGPDRFIVQAYGIKTDGKKPLSGWIHLLIKLNTPGATISRFVINARGKTSSSFGGVWVTGIGEFINEEFPGSKCGTTKVSSPSEPIFPCGGVAVFEPTLGNGFSYINDGNDSISEFHLNFRFTQTTCNFYKTMNFRIEGFQSASGGNKKIAGTSDTIEFVTNFLNGAPDPIPLSGSEASITLTCDKLLSEEAKENALLGGKPGQPPPGGSPGGGFGPGQGGLDYPYLKEVIPVELSLIKKCPPGVTSKLKTKTGKTKRGLTSSGGQDEFTCVPEKSLADDKDLFVGRCNGTQATSRGSKEFCQVCHEPSDLNPAFLDSLTNFQDYLREIVNETIEYRCTTNENLTAICAFPHKNGTGAIISPSSGNNTNKTFADDATELTAKKLGVPAKISIIFDEIWDTRVIHSQFMIIWTFSILPINFLLARYYKETFMGFRILEQRVWYFFHHFLTGVSLMLCFAGTYRVYRRRDIFGVSVTTAGFIHRFSGWLTMILTLILAFLGGWRPMSRILRAVFVALHFSFGWLVYLLSLSCIISSAYIPGSPSADSSIFDELTFHKIVGMVIVRILIDIAFHVILTLNMVTGDKLVILWRKRFYLPSPIPVLNENDDYDMPKSKMRRILLLVYLIVSILLTVITCIFILAADPRAGDNQNTIGLGPMSCTHDSNGDLKSEFDLDC